MDSIAVVLGAGASYDAHLTSMAAVLNNPDWRPPLVRDLFTRASFWSIAKKYPLVQFVTPRLATLSSRGSFSLEDELRDIATDQDPQMRQAFRELPLYIRDVLAKCSRDYLTFPAAHVALVEKLRPGYLSNVMFITTNYDDLIEQALTRYNSSLFKFTHIDSYVRPQATILKLHGSINWGIPIAALGGGDERTWLGHLSKVDPLNLPHDDIRMIAPQGDSYALTVSEPGRESFWAYPAITAPLAGKTAHDVVAPTPHLEAANEALPRCTRLLIAGHSGLDDDLIELLSSSMTVLEQVDVVAESHEAVARTLERFSKAAAIREAPMVRRFHQGFSSYLTEPTGLVDFF